MYTQTINSVVDVEGFFHHLIVDRKMYGFHPDDGFESCDDMTILEAKSYANMLDKCFDICEEANVDLYEICANILHEELEKQR